MDALELMERADAAMECQWPGLQGVPGGNAVYVATDLMLVCSKGDEAQRSTSGDNNNRIRHAGGSRDGPGTQSAMNR